MNFRLETDNDLSNDDFRRLCADENAFRDMIIFDQLFFSSKTEKLNHIFVDFKEPDILNFRPTYKYDPGTTRWDTSEKSRCPAWCDRILWWNRDGVNVRQQFYESVESVMFSDHKPVRSIFHVEIRSIDEVKRDACLEEAVREADRRANEALPQIELSQNEIYGVCSQSELFRWISAKPNRIALCEPWLSITPPNARLQPGASCTISLQILVDKAVAWTMSGDGKLSEILVLRLHHGRHYFVTVSGQYQHSVFGSSFIDLIHKEKKETSSSELVNLAFSSTSVISAVMAGIPESVFRIGEALKQNGLEKIRFDDPSAHSEFIALRNALDTGKPINLFEACKSAFSMYDTLLTLITSFKESIIPPTLQTECLRAAGDIISCWSSQMQLLADIIFKRLTGDDGYLQRLKFLETFVSEDYSASAFCKIYSFLKLAEISVVYCVDW
ncbi:Endonuclease/Exonuclease/phosphatase [Dirofilaria immitis]|nr:Endonuclease/Exonuclease/phosphatase [Dirofilaria immitis]